MGLWVHMEDSGPLGEGSCCRLFTEIALHQASVNVALAAGETKKLILFQRGQPLACASNVLSETLGVYLVAQGLITPAQDKLCLEAAGTRKDLPYGEALVAKRIVDPMTLAQMMGSLLEERLRQALTLTEGLYQLSSYKDAGLPPVRMERPLLQLVLTHAVSSVNTAATAADPEQVPLMMTMGGLKFETLAATPKDLAILRLINGVQNVREIIAKSKAEGARVLALLGALQRMGLLEFLDLPHAAPRHSG